jgi:hypothetical protein
VFDLLLVGVVVVGVVLGPGVKDYHIGSNFWEEVLPY